MIENKEGNGHSSNTEIQHLCGKLLDFTLSEPEVDRLNELLANSNSAREYYFQLMQIHSLIRPSILTDSNEQLCEEIEQEDSSAKRKPVILQSIEGSLGHPSRWLTLLLALVGAFLAVFFITNDRREVVGEDSFGGRSEIFARVERMVNAEFSANAKTWRPGNHLLTGETFEIERGLALLRFEDNSEVIVEGPSRIEFIDNANFYLHVGKVTIRDPGVGQGSVVATPVGVFTNNRAEYGLQVEDKSKVNVEVFVGLVEVHARAHRIGVAPNMEARWTIEAGEKQSLRLEQSGGLKAESEDVNHTDKFVRFLPFSNTGSEESEFLVVTDGFGQMKTGSLVGSSTGGFGWVGSWRNDRVDNQSAAVIFFDGQAVSQGSGDGAVWRHVAPDIRSSSPVYFSCVLSVDGSDPICSVWLALFNFDDMTINNGEGNLATIGVSDGRFCGRLSASLRSAQEQRTDGDFGKYVAGNSHLVVGKLEFNVDGGKAERLSVWVDPSRSDLSSPDRIIEYDTKQDQFDTVAIRFWDFEHGTIGRVDDVRISRSWDDAIR